MIVDNFFSLEMKLYYQKGFVSVCTCMIECVYVCVRVRWVVGHLQLQAVYVCPNGKVLFSLSSRGPQAVCGGYLFTLSQGTLLLPVQTYSCTLEVTNTPKNSPHSQLERSTFLNPYVVVSINIACTHPCTHTYI